MTHNVCPAIADISCPVVCAELVGFASQDNQKHKLVVVARTGCVVRSLQSTLMLGLLHMITASALQRVEAALRLVSWFALEGYRHWTKRVMVRHCQEKKTVLRVLEVVAQLHQM